MSIQVGGFQDFGHSPFLCARGVPEKKQKRNKTTAAQTPAFKSLVAMLLLVA
jgi:hypothetical protein